jgi:hypothetical protein
LLFCAWRYGGEDPWKTYNLLDADYRPMWAPDLAPVRPQRPTRVRAFMYSCAKVAAIMDGKMKTATTGSRRR